jgi:hypothetical protein
MTTTPAVAVRPVPYKGKHSLAKTQTISLSTIDDMCAHSLICEHARFGLLCSPLVRPSEDSS